MTEELRLEEDEFDSIGYGSSVNRAVREKVVDVQDLAKISAILRQEGKSVVLAHGTFDLMHMGHVRHLETARQHGDVLMVTLTADVFVNKGPGRPVFSEFLRAEMIAALQYVDWVAINPAPDAIPVLESVRPDVYAKGQDYEDAESDVTGKIAEERRAAESYGGKLIFTDEITFSSSTLINQHLSVFAPHVRKHLHEVRERGGLAHCLELLDKIRDMRIMMVGETIIDEYQYVFPMAKAPKENMLATRFVDREVFAGGIVAAANHLASFCKEIEIVTCLGSRDRYEDMVRDSLAPNIKITTLTQENAPTLRKTRFVENTYMRKLFEVYDYQDEAVSPELARSLNAIIEERAGNFDLVSVTDFGHGFIGRSTVDTLVRSAPFLAVNTQTNSGNLGFNLISKYPRADFICLDALEAQLATRNRHSDLTSIASEHLPAIVDTNNVIVTHGKHGCVAYSKGGEAQTIPAVAGEVVDTVGAGDAFFSVTAPLVAAGAPLELAGLIGNVIGGLKVGIVGHRKSVSKVDTVKALTALLK